MAWFSIAVSICLLFAVSLASPLPTETATWILPRSSTEEEHPDWGCSFPGNSDLYGLGIRLGVYLQLFSTLLANAFLSRTNRDDAHNTNAIIMIAIFAGMANATIRGDLNAVEIFVMSTLLTAFLWSEFTPRHISGIVLFESAGTSWDGVNKKRLYRERRDKRIQDGWVVGHTFDQNLQPDPTPPGIDTKKSYFAAFLRSAFGTAVGIFVLWYWFDGRNTLLKNGIEDPVCKPTIFLHQQIVLQGYQPMLYIVFSVLYAVWEVTFMVWWVVILAPGTARLLYDSLCIITVSVCTFKFKRLREIRLKFAKWYLTFAQLDDQKLKIFSRLRFTNKTQERVRRYKFYVSWWGLPVGYSVIIWSTLAIELTLAWNRVPGIYVLGSTGQLIPFVVGVLGLLRNIHLIAVKISERTGKKKKDREIEVLKEKGKWFYGDGKEGSYWLEAGCPRRRGSIDSELPRHLDCASEANWSSESLSCSCSTRKSEEE